MDLYVLPYEILYNILSNLSPIQISNICQTSVYGNIICRDESLWKRFIYDKYGVMDKIYEDKNWYDNYVYITLSFTREQLIVIDTIRRKSPTKFKLLKELHNYNQFLNRLNDENVELISVIAHIDISHIDASEYNVEIYSPNAIYKILYSLSINNNRLVAESFSYIDSSLSRTLQRNKAYIGNSIYNTTLYYAVLNRKQLSILPYMFQ